MGFIYGLKPVPTGVALFAFCSLKQTIYGNVENHLSGWALCRPLRDSYINLRLPGTPVPGYRLYRPYGTAGAESLQARCRLIAQSKTTSLPGSITWGEPQAHGDTAEPCPSAG